MGKLSLHNKPDVAIKVGDLEDMLIYSSRYALRRFSYAFSDACSLIMRYEQFISFYTKDVIAKDIEELLKEGHVYGRDKETLQMLKYHLEKSRDKVREA